MKTIATLIAATALVAGASSLANAQAYEQIANPNLSRSHIEQSNQLGIPPRTPADLLSGRSVAIDGQLVAPQSDYYAR